MPNLKRGQHEHHRESLSTTPKASKSSGTPDDGSVDIERILQTLNSEQYKAVQYEPSIPLQILAGPGSGKTKVLISRIAQLILSHKLPPSTICAVTFTNKAANEMRERLTAIIGKTQTQLLQMGTFHSLCAKFLRIYSRHVNLGTNFTICDSDESKKLISALLKPYKEYLDEHDMPLTEGQVASAISKAKAKGYSAETYGQEVMHSSRNIAKSKTSVNQAAQDQKTIEQIQAEVYAGYEQILRQNNALDFDDLLIYGVKLFSEHRDSVSWCRHILVDEFQDTNTMQYELMKCIAIKRCITIVGDPDQSIYGWRSAEVVNLSRMRQDFPDTCQIFLETNYRSTKAILRASLAIVAEDKKRIQKSLHTSNPLGFSPAIGEFESEKEEAAFIAFEIKRCVANMGGVLRWGDFVVLLRFNALSRPIESALQKVGIPCRILGGHKFFERMEVKDILSYLQLVDNPDFNPSFVRAIKAPSRGMGDKSLAELASRATDLKISQLCLVENIHDNKVPDIKPPIKRKIVSFVQTIRRLRKMDAENQLPSEMIRKLCTLINYEDHLRKTQQDWESRWENVQELITFASEVEAEAPNAGGQNPLTETDHPLENEEKQTVLRQFLQASMLSSEGDNQSEEQSKEKVTLSTCHAAKGLEWPVVIIPSVDQDTFPFYRTEDIEEERRLLYVACTRAQSLLYLCYSLRRQIAGKTKQKKLSDFVSVIHNKNQGYFSHDAPRFLPQDREVISKVLGRPLPDEAEIAKKLGELESSGAQLQSTFNRANGTFSAVNLTGVKTSVQNEDAIRYAAPDVLATISTTFMKDYKRPAFSNAPRPASRATDFQASFISASSVKQSLFSAPLEESPLQLLGGAAEGSSSRLPESSLPLQGPKRRMANRSPRQITLDQKWLSSNHCKANAIMTDENEAYPSKTPRSDSVPSLITAGSTSSLSLPNSASTAKFVPPTIPLSTDGSSCGSRFNNSATAVGEGQLPRSKNGHSYFTSPAHAFKGIATEARISGQWSASNQNEPRLRTSEGNTLRPVRSNTGLTTRVLPDKNSADYDMTCAGDAATPRMPPHGVCHNPLAPHVSMSLEGAKPTLHEVVNPSDNGASQPTTQTSGKRRLGMGRTTTGYSNKKFKRPV